MTVISETIRCDFTTEGGRGCSQLSGPADRQTLIKLLTLGKEKCSYFGKLNGGMPCKDACSLKDYAEKERQEMDAVHSIGSKLL